MSAANLACGRGPNLGGGGATITGDQLKHLGHLAAGHQAQLVLSAREWAERQAELERRRQVSRLVTGYLACGLAGRGTAPGAWGRMN
jgi:hypothetical protein